MKKITWIISLLVVIMINLSAKSFQFRSWQIGGINWEYLKKTIPLAKEKGMNRIKLGTGDLDELWNERNEEDSEELDLTKKAIKLAKSNGLKVDMATDEISSPPNRLLKNGELQFEPETWEWINNKYEGIFKLLPNLDGVVLSFVEAGFSISGVQQVGGQRSPDIEEEEGINNIVKLVESIHEACVSHDKLLIIRTFGHYPRELEWIESAYSKINDRLDGADNIIVMSKIVPHDWHPYYPYSSMLGKFENLPQIVEIDLGNEYTGKNVTLYPMIDYVKEALYYAKSKGAIGAIGRVDRNQYSAIGTPNQVNVDAFSKLLNNLSLETETIWRNWCEKKYGEGTAKTLVPALKRFYDITNITYFPLKQWLYFHSVLSEYDYALKHLTRFDNYSIRRWVPSYHYKHLYKQKRYPTEDTFLKVEHEKQLGRKLLEKSKRDLESIKESLSKSDYNSLKKYFDRSDIFLEIFKHHSLAFFKMVRYQSIYYSHKSTQKEYINLKNEIEEHCDNLDNLAIKLEENYSEEELHTDSDQIRSYAETLRSRLKEHAD